MADPRLDVFKALGDNTRYAIYLELARSVSPLSTAEIAETLALHPNTVRPHLERMRDVGLLEIEVAARGGVGRPQHLYSLAADAPSLGLEPPAYPVLARMLVTMAARAGLDDSDAVEAGREQGSCDAAAFQDSPSCLEALVDCLGVLGFDPTIDGTDDGETAVVGFSRCPFRDLATDHPDLVCGLHRGMVEGFVDTFGGGSVDDFHSLPHRDPCQVTISTR